MKFNSQKLMHIAYSVGGSVVIVGALAKILHIDLMGISGSTLLGTGLGVEALLFLIGAFDFSGIEDTTSQKMAFEFSEDDAKSTGNKLNFMEEVPVTAQLEEQNAAVKENLTELADNVSELSGVYKGMLDQLKK